MAVYDGDVDYTDVDLQAWYWVDPNRYRATIWTNTPEWQLVRKMVDKDRMRLRKRVSEWVEKNKERYRKNQMR